MPISLILFLLVETVHVSLNRLLEILSLLLVIQDERCIVPGLQVCSNAWLEVTLVLWSDMAFKVLFLVKLCSKRSLIKSKVVTQAFRLLMINLLEWHPRFTTEYFVGEALYLSDSLIYKDFSVKLVLNSGKRTFCSMGCRLYV